MTVKQKVQAAITASNATTGASDTDLTSAVKRLIAGYGQGGSVDLSDVGVYVLDFFNDTITLTAGAASKYGGYFTT